MDKKKSLLIFFILLFTPCALFSQDWAPIGAKWHYDSMDGGQSPPSSSYYLYESTKDTTINSKSCRKIEVTYYSSQYGTVIQPSEYMYSDSGKVYYYWSGDFRVLYDFNATTGDTIQVYNRLIPDTNAYYSITDFRVDSVKLLKDVITDTSLYNNIDSLKLQYLRPVSTHGYWVSFGSYPIIENIGSADEMFPTASFTIPEKDGPLRCYQYDTLLYKPFLLDCDYWIPTSIPDLLTVQQNIVVYPNPTTGQITITNLPKQTTGIIVYNVLGELVYDSPFINRHIDLSCLPVGIYMLHIVQGEPIFRKKVIKVF